MQINKNAEKLIRQLNNQGYEAFIVGGCVRDYLLELTPHDTDICTNALPEQTKKCFEAYHTFDTGIKHGTISVVCGGEVYEITTYRIDGDYSDNRHPDSVSFTRNINEDLRRRDFTVNAMAYNAEYGLVDPYGGKNDLKDKIIRCVGNPDTRFNEDALRILRALRFASVYGFSIEENTSKNKSKVYQYIYRKKTTSKLQIVQELQMGLSTVSQNLNLLEQEGLIEKNGFFESTGGRKANALQIVSDFKISIGIGILKGMFHITAVDLYGNAFYTDTIPLPYSNTPDYYKQVTDAVKKFISSRQYDNDKVLGISIATQGITSPDHTTVLYGDIMNNAGMKLDDFSRYLPYPCYLEHDSKSAAFLELWNHPELDSAVIILLNRNLGGGIITNHQIHQGISMHSGTLEHICINPDGPLCYCGSRGCLGRNHYGMTDPTNNRR